MVTKKVLGPSNNDREENISSQQLLTGTTLVDRYKIQDVIGIGGMGSVYRARDLHFPNVVKLVAVKEMINKAPDPVMRNTIVQNFEREANILATLDHPSIPRIYDYFTEGDRSYLILEFINGRDLETILLSTNGFLPEEQILPWAIQLCEVLAFLHNHKPEKIIFRDMKPSNVIISLQGNVVLVDFGIAKTFQAGQKGTMIGTEGYSPPEQYRGEATHLADLYSLGATLHHVLSKRDPRLEPPFSFAERPIRKINPSMSAELEAVINTALQYDPEERYQTAEAMKEALIAAGQKTGKLSRTGLTTSAVHNENIKPLWTFQSEDEIRGSPVIYEGSVYFGSSDHNLYSLNSTTGEFHWKYATDGGIVNRPAVFEGNIFTGSEDQRLHAVNARTGKVVWTYFTGDRILSSPRIAEGHLFIGSDDHFLHAVNVATGRAAWRFETTAEIRSSPFIAGDSVYFGCESGDFYAVDFKGELRWRFKAKLAVTSSPLVEDGVVYFCSLDGHLYALEAKTGWLVWRFRMGKGSVVTPAMADNILIAGSADGVIYAVEPHTSKEIWQFHTDHQVSGSPVIHKDSIYCGSAGGILYCLDYRTGRTRWKFETGGPITAAPVVFDDFLYTGSADHNLYALLV